MATPPSEFPYIHEKCQAAARLFDIPVEHLLVFARIESNFDPKAVNNGSGAAGLFQYVRSTAAEEHINPLRVPEACAATARRISRDIEHLRTVAEIHEPELVDLYLVHQQGRRGFGEIYEALTSHGTLTAPRIRNILSNLPRSIARHVDDPDLTAGEKATVFYDWWATRIAKALKEVESYVSS